MQGILCVPRGKKQKGMAEYMNKKRKTATRRAFAAILAALLIAAVSVLPALALDIGGMNGMRHGARRGARTGETTDAPPIGEGIESAIDDVTGGIESAVDDVTDRVDDMTDGTDGTDGPADDTADSTDEGLMGDESLEDGTNIPDSDIGGAVEDNDGDGISDPTDSDDDNDGVLDSVDTDANGDGKDDGTMTAGIIGIVVAVIVVIAVVILVIAVMPRGRKKK